MSQLRVKLGVFGAVPLLLLQDKRIKPNAIKVYISLSSFQGTKDNCNPPLEDIATRAGVTVDAAVTAITNLVETGWVSKKRKGRGHNNQYEVMAYFEPSDEFQNRIDQRKNNKFHEEESDLITDIFQNQEDIQITEKIQNPDCGNNPKRDCGNNPKSIVLKDHVKDQNEKTNYASADAEASQKAVATIPRKKTDLAPQELALYGEIKRWFESKPESVALMYKDKGAAGRTGKALKIIVERCFNHSKTYGGDPLAIARPMVSMFHKAVYEKTGRDKLRVTFTPVGLATEWVWDTIYVQCKDHVEIGSQELIAQKIQESLRRKEESIKRGGVEI